MEKKPEESTPQNPVENEVEQETQDTEEKSDSISREELEDLKRKAEVSSQNYERLKKIEEENKKLQDKLQDLEVLSEDNDDDEDIKSEIVELKQRLNKADLINQFPEMAEVWEEFEAFKNDPENKGMNINTAAKAFRVEKGLVGKPRKGLEKQTGGDRIPVLDNKMSAEDAKKLRETDYRKYRDMLKKGQIVIR